MWRPFSIANWWEDRRILDKICLYFLFFIWRRYSEISNTFLISLYNINDVRDLTPSRHSAMYISFNLNFKSGKNLLGFTEFGNIQTSGNPDRSSNFFTFDAQLFAFMLASISILSIVYAFQRIQLLLSTELIFKKYLTIRDWRQSSNGNLPTSP